MNSKIGVFLIICVLSLSSLHCGKKETLSAGIQLLQKEVRSDPQNWRLRFELAERLSKEEHFQLAIEELNTLLKSHPHDPQVMDKLADVYLEEKNMDAALETAQKMIEHNPSDGLGYATLGRLHFHRGDYEKTESSLKKAIQLGNWDEATNLLILYRLSYSKLKLNKEKEANQIMDKILELDPFHEKTLFFLALDNFKKQKWEESEMFLRRLTSKYRDNFRYFLILGLVYYHQAKWNLCQQYLRKSYELDPRSRSIGMIADLSNFYEIPEKWNLAFVIKFRKERQYRENGKYIVWGDAINIGFRIAKDSRVSVDYFDKNRIMVNDEWAYLRPRNLMPMQIREYRIVVPDQPEIKTAKVHFNWMKSSLQYQREKARWER